MLTDREVVAVSEAARALFTAGIHRLTGAGSILLAVPTAAEAERLAGDLVPMLGAEAVELFPAWETLPFERVSPALETMGRRLRIMWRLREGGERAPAVVVAPVRALVQRLGPHVEAVEPVVVSVPVTATEPGPVLAGCEAVTVQEPAATALMTPFSVTVAFVGSEETHTDCCVMT